VIKRVNGRFVRERPYETSDMKVTRARLPSLDYYDKRTIENCDWIGSETCGTCYRNVCVDAKRRKWFICGKRAGWNSVSPRWAKMYRRESRFWSNFGFRSCVHATLAIIFLLFYNRKSTKLLLFYITSIC